MKPIVKWGASAIFLALLYAGCSYTVERCQLVPEYDGGAIADFQRAYSFLIEDAPEIWADYAWTDLSLLLISPKTGRAYLFNSNEDISGFHSPCDNKSGPVSMRISKSLFGDLKWQDDGYLIKYPTPGGKSVFVEYLTEQDVDGEEIEAQNNNAVVFKNNHPIAEVIHENFHEFQGREFKYNVDKDVKGQISYPVAISDFELLPYLIAQVLVLRDVIPVAEVGERWKKDGGEPRKIMQEYLEEFDGPSPAARKKAIKELLAIRSLLKQKQPEKFKNYETHERLESAAAYVEYKWLEKLGLSGKDGNVVDAWLFVLMRPEGRGFGAKFQTIFTYNFAQILYEWFEELLPDWKSRMTEGKTLSDLLYDVVGDKTSPVTEADLSAKIKDTSFEKLYKEAMDFNRMKTDLFKTFELESPDHLEVHIHSDPIPGGPVKLNRLIISDEEKGAVHTNSDFTIVSPNLEFHTKNAFLLEYLRSKVELSFKIISDEEMQIEGADLQSLYKSGGRKRAKGKIKILQKNIKEKILGMESDQEAYVLISFDAVAEFRRKETGMMVLDLWLDD